MPKVADTDHEGFLLDLFPAGSGAAAACTWRDARHNAQQPAAPQSPPSGWALTADGVYRLMLRGSDGHVHQAWWRSGAGWQTQDIGGDTGGSPAVLQHGERLDVFVTADNGDVWQRTYQGATWDAWHVVRTLAGHPVRAAQGSGLAAAWIGASPRVYSVAPSGHAFQSYYDDAGWHSEDLGSPGALSGTLGVTYAGGRLDVFGTRSAGQVEQRTYRDGQWDAWHALVTNHGKGSPITAKPGTGVAAAAGIGPPRLLTVSPHGNLYQSWYDTGTGWHSQDLGAGYAGVPAVIVHGARMDVFAADTSGAIVQRTLSDGGWDGAHRVVARP